MVTAPLPKGVLWCCSQNAAWLRLCFQQHRQQYRELCPRYYQLNSRSFIPRLLKLEERVSAMKWEHQIVVDPTPELINTLGFREWKLVTVAPDPKSDKALIYFFKRPAWEPAGNAIDPDLTKFLLPTNAFG